MSEAMPTTGKWLCEERACRLLDRKQSSEVFWGRRQTPQEVKQCVCESDLSELWGKWSTLDIPWTVFPAAVCGTPNPWLLQDISEGGR